MVIYPKCQFSWTQIQINVTATTICLAWLKKFSLSQLPESRLSVLMISLLLTSPLAMVLQEEYRQLAVLDLEDQEEEDTDDDMNDEEEDLVEEDRVRGLISEGEDNDERSDDDDEEEPPSL
ncbi:hypothetical protein Z517_09341 [Fonsecaea pedrosoi CBS 271.37]|uniref:Uncharacterized protein n=1 Tax=Fonsecaea pedrosoi CBS 271.37 TaxID=1442368 RepID=A0A0D2ERL4_9EURO|nr:uncharacterized protein Z517_09341 [Fonsecaea pedrosoi CBS 271.37]KIW76897.1 hypothetical protein Z517_09341 [Fonsecaea pedrosoi CBS 271.37]